jgi:hypothetical protein
MDEDGNARGYGREPSNALVNSGCAFEDLALGQRVIAFWWGFWFPCIVQYLSKKNKTATVRFQFSHQAVSGYAPRLLRPYNP